MPGESDSVTLAADGAPSRPDEQPVERGTQLGRYVVLGLIGGGGMGLVHAAYDPDLDRKVALKLLRTLPGGSTAARARARLLREAQMLAKLSHPNVVAVYDVGTVGEQVWIAMEFVDGPTLATWARQSPRRWTEILDVVLAAARGLASAHAIGILHRDLKPENIMIGSDGRPRVADFGLARLGSIDEPTTVDPDANEGSTRTAMHATQAGAIVGTPAYMSPEQLLGKPVDAKSDQFSLCVTLWELLYSERPFAGDTLIERASAALSGKLQTPRREHDVPKWLRRVCERGLSLQPERRFEDVAALIAALERGRAGARRAPFMVGLAAVLLAGLGVAGAQRWSEARQVAACEASGAEIESSWNEQTRARLHDDLLATGLRYASSTAELVEQRLTDNAEAWRANATAACLDAQVEHRIDVAMHERMQWCLQERRLEFASVLEQLRDVDVRTIQRAVPLVTALVDVAPCRDPARLASQPAPPAAADREAIVALRSELATVSARLWAGEVESALEPARAVSAQAEGLGWPPLLASAKQTEASVLVAAGRYAEAERAGLEAYRRAAGVQAWGVAASAAEQLITIIGHHQVRPAEARAWAMHAEIAAGLAGDPGRHHEVTRVSNLGIVEYTAGDRRRARELFELANELNVLAYGPDHANVAKGLNNLANAHYEDGDYAGAIALARRALAIREQVLGPDHPELASTLANLSVFLLMAGNETDALALQQRALDLRRAAFGPSHPEVGSSLSNLGAMYHALHRDEEARRVLAEAIAVFEATVGPTDPLLVAPLIALGQIEHEAGAYDLAATHMQRGLAIEERALGPEHPEVAGALRQLGRLEASRHEPAKAKALLERALAIEAREMPANHIQHAETLYELGRALVALGDVPAGISRFEEAIAIVDANPTSPSIARFARVSLARALVATGGDRARALDLAEHARAAFARTGESELVAEIDAWLAEQRANTPAPRGPSR
ncbi:MAG: serine/threonine-protein kinase [Nannocystaceae bacterium]|nr:serine/threonine-protein kinase [Nannocystaceae bacterium]